MMLLLWSSGASEIRIRLCVSNVAVDIYAGILQGGQIPVWYNLKWTATIGSNREWCVNQYLMHYKMSHPAANQLSDQYSVSQFLTQFNMSQIQAPSTIYDSLTKTAPCDSSTQYELSKLCEVSQFIVQ